MTRNRIRYGQPVRSDTGPNQAVEVVGLLQDRVVVAAEELSARNSG